jgi:small subunit ribosomal protein S4e
MAVSHLKRLNAPKSWKIKRSGQKFITRPNPGPHTMDLCMPVNTILKDMLGIAVTAKEVKHLVTGKDVMVDGIVVKDIKRPVGVMDVLSIAKLEETYRILIDEKGYLQLLKIDKKESNIKPCKIIKKTALKGGKLQLNLSYGINLLVNKKDYKTGDTLMLDMPSKNIISHVSMEKGAYIYLTGGKHIGDHGVLDTIKEGSVFYKSKSGQTMETLKRFAIAVGKDKPSITLLK